MGIFVVAYSGGWNFLGISPWKYLAVGLLMAYLAWCLWPSGHILPDGEPAESRTAPYVMAVLAVLLAALSAKLWIG